MGDSPRPTPSCPPALPSRLQRPSVNSESSQLAVTWGVLRCGLWSATGSTPFRSWHTDRYVTHVAVPLDEPLGAFYNSVSVCRRPAATFRTHHGKHTI